MGRHAIAFRQIALQKAKQNVHRMQAGFTITSSMSPLSVNSDCDNLEQRSCLLPAVRWSKIFWLVTLAALSIMLLSLPRSPLPWLDEMLFASTSLSMVRGGPPVPTVLAAFPHWESFILPHEAWLILLLCLVLIRARTLSRRAATEIRQGLAGRLTRTTGT
jgi:hypothetical protein